MLFFGALYSKTNQPKTHYEILGCGLHGETNGGCDLCVCTWNDAKRL